MEMWSCRVVPLAAAGADQHLLRRQQKGVGFTVVDAPADNLPVVVDRVRELQHPGLIGDQIVEIL